MIIFGIDPSLTGTGLCMLDVEKDDFSVKTLHIKKEDKKKKRTANDDMERLDLLEIQFSQFIQSYTSENRKCAAFVEGYAMGVRGSRVFSLGEWGGILRLTLYRLGVPFYNIPPTKLKKFVTGKGVGDKNIILEQTFRKFGVGSEVLKNDDEVDAYVLAKLGESYLQWKNNKTDFLKYEIEVFKGKDKTPIVGPIVK
jgi:Holliday junction resolvasome RuvABC endonuclease subunit